jgi:hypothetical protein
VGTSDNTLVSLKLLVKDAAYVYDRLKPEVKDVEHIHLDYDFEDLLYNFEDGISVGIDF